MPECEGSRRWEECKPCGRLTVHRRSNESNGWTCLICRNHKSDPNPFTKIWSLFNRESKMNNKLMKLIRKNCVQHNNIVLSSGKKSDVYFDLKKICFTDKGSKLIRKALKKELLNFNFDAIGGHSYGGMPLVCSLLQDFKNGFLVRKEPKEYGNKNLIEGAVSPGMKVAIVEDVVTTGGSVSKAIDAVSAFGMYVVAVVAVINRKEGGDELFSKLKIPFRYLFESEILLNGNKKT